MKLKFTAQALNDLHRLKVFIAQNNPIAARIHIDKLLKVIKQIKAQPEIGKKLENELLARQIVAGNYIVHYSIRDSVIYILKIWHGKEKR